MVGCLVSYSIVSRLIGLILVLAGILKGYALTVGWMPGEDFLSNRWLLAGVSGFEIVFGFWLLAGLHPRLTWWLSLFCCGAFLGDNLSKALAGHSSCGCFGQIEIRPWWASMLDATLIILLLFGPPARDSGPSPNPRWRLSAFGLLCLLGAVSGLFMFWHFSPKPLGPEGEIGEDAPVVTLHPKTWIGQRFPLLQHIDIGNQLDRGSWILLFYRASCPECQQAIPRYVALGYEFADRAGAPRIALIEVPPFEGNSSDAYRGGKFCTRGRLSDRRHWIWTTPWFVGLRDGMVTVATTSPEFFLNNPAGSFSEGNPGSLAREMPNGGEGSPFPDYCQARRNLFLREIACGPLALIAILQHFAIPLATADVDQMLEAAGTHGIDLLQLKELAERHGLSALGVKVTTAKLRDMGQPAIVHLDQIGFAAVTGFTPDGLVIVYPLKSPGIVPDDLFAKGFGKTGSALLLSRNPLSPQKLALGPADTDIRNEGPVLRPTKSSLSVGRIYAHRWRATLPLSNPGTEALSIQGVRCSCPCMTARVDQDHLEPGQSTVLRVDGEQKRLGSFLYFIDLQTNQRQNSTVRVPVRGYLEQPVGFEKPAEMVQGLLPQRCAQVETLLDLSPGIDPAQLQVEVPSQAPLSAEIRKRPDQKPSLVVRYHGDSRIGWHRYQIGLKVKDIPECVTSLFQFAVGCSPFSGPLEMRVRAYYGP